MSIVRHCFHIISRQLAYVAIIFASLLTLVIASVYWLSNAVEQRQDEIASWVSSYIGYPVAMSGAGLHWIGLEPKLQVNNITILRQNGQEQLLSLEQLYLGLDIISSLQQAEPVINDVSLSGLVISVIRSEQGKFVIQGLSADSDPSPNKDWLRWVNLINKVNLDNITLALSDFKQPLLSGHYLLNQAQIEHDDSQWRSTLDLTLPEQLGNSIQITAETEINASFELGHWQAQVKLDSVELAAFSDIVVWQDISLTKGRINSTLSLSGNDTKVDVITSSINANQLELTSLNASAASAKIDRLSGYLDWSGASPQWQLSGRELQLRMNGEDWVPTDFKLNNHADNTLSFASSYLRLSDLTTIASLTELSPEFIRKQRPAGDVESVSLSYSPEQGLTAIAFELRDGGLLPWQQLPGVTGLTASINWNNDIGNVSFDSHKLILYPEGWLDKSVFFDSVTGVISVNRQQDKWIIQSQAFRLWNDDLTMQLDGTIERNADGRIVNDLAMSLQDVEINAWKSYVPQRILDQDFKAWSNDAFVAGRVIDGKIELLGDLADFPYDNAPDKGRFTMDLHLEGAQLRYAPKWPDIVDLEAKIVSQGSLLVITSKQGKIAGFDFIDVTTTIERFVLSAPILSVRGDMTGTSQQALTFLQNSPLKQRFGRVSETVTAQGQSDIHLDLLVPLTHVDDSQASGWLSFKGSSLRSVDATELSVTNVIGALKFNNEGVFANAIKARFLDDDIVINVSPEQDKTTVDVTGRSSIDKVNTVFNNTIPTFVSGQFNYQLDVSIAEKTLGEFYVDAVLHSDLQGLALNLPAPFSKQSDQTKAFRAGFEHVNDELVYTINYEDVVNAIVMPQGKKWRGEFRLGEGQPSLPDHGIKIRGQLANISIDDWLIAWQANQKMDSESTLVDSFDDVSVTINALNGFEQKLTQLNVSMQRDAQGWRTQFHSQQSKGTLYLPLRFDNNAMLRVDIDKITIHLPKETKSDLSVAEKDKKSSVLWPAMAINIGSLTLDDMNLGQLSLRSKRTQDAWIIEQGTLASEYFSANVTKGVWQKLATGDSSHISLQSKSDNLAGLLKSLGYIQAVDATGIEIGLDFTWPDQPLSVSTERIQGQINIKVGKGTLTEIESGAAGRIFGLLSVAAIPRRLSLDFSDLFGKGFSFDSIAGDFNLANGLATTDNMTMKAESALIEMTGPIDIVNKSYNQHVKVTPNVSSTLPLAGAMAGGPIGLGVGAAILLFDKLADNLFDKNIVNLISYKYDLTGPWNDPQLNVVKPAVQ
ncbi:MAG: TIGR02099 family protein [Gammaproteobacteria bacterium]|nr:TIGR02099 family protein [Gammaproteobacteria bacterium]